MQRVGRISTNRELFTNRARAEELEDVTRHGCGISWRVKCTWLLDSRGTYTCASIRCVHVEQAPSLAGSTADTCRLDSHFRPIDLDDRRQKYAKAAAAIGGPKQTFLTHSTLTFFCSVSSGFFARQGSESTAWQRQRDRFDRLRFTSSCSKPVLSLARQDPLHFAMAPAMGGM